jgi:carbon starvation protein
MTSLSLLVFVTCICLLGYVCYGKWLAKKWGINVSAKTPAERLNDGNDYVPTSKLMVFAHQFSSIAGAGPITGPILAAMFGWIPVLLWVVVGGIFFGGVQDFASLYASVKEDGKSIGMIIEKYIGKAGKRVFLLFIWLFCMLLMAAFIDIVAGTFDGFRSNGDLNVINGSVASISILYIFVALFFGYLTYKFKIADYQQIILGLALVLLMCVVGLKFPIYFTKQIWLYVLLVYMFAVSILPMWLLKDPRDFLSSFLLLGIMLASVIGIIFINPTLEINAFSGFNVNGKSFFPFLFVTVACGAVSGIHGLISSGTSSKTIKNEGDMLFVGYGAMMVECVLAIISLIAVGSLAKGGVLPQGTPIQIFSLAVGSFLGKLGLSANVSNSIVAMCVSAFALTSLDAIGRIGRMSFQELFTNDTVEAKKTLLKKVLTNGYFALGLTLLGGYALCLGGYQNIWPLFGAANQLCSALILISLLVFFKSTKRCETMLYIPVVFMLLVTLTTLIMSIIAIYNKLSLGTFIFIIDGFQLIIASALVVLALLVVYYSVKRLYGVDRVKI